LQTCVLVAAHGERRPDADHAPIARFTERLAALLPDAHVRFGLINAEPGLASALAPVGRQPVVIYPLLMADGYFMTRLRSQIADQRYLDAGAIIWAAPFGLDPDLPDLIVTRLAREALATSRVLGDVDLVMSAHGSTVGPRPREAARSLVDRLVQRAVVRSIALGFVEEAPFLAETFATVPAGAWHVGLFAGAGVHAAADVPEAMAQAGRADIADLGLVTDWPESAALAARAIRRALVGGEGLEPPTSCV
jgi:sirohydrochlorin ferrochelatase